jgi:dihydrofolate reductase
MELTQALLAAGLVDRHHLTVLPIVLRGGHRLFDGEVPPTKFRLAEAKTTPTGVQLLTLVPDGAVVQGHF